MSRSTVRSLTSSRRASSAAVTRPCRWRMSTKVISRPARTRPVSRGRCIHDKRCHLWPGKLRASRWTVTSKGEGDAVASNELEGSGTPQDPWVLKTPPGTSEFEAYRDPDAAPPALVVQVDATELRYHLRCIEDLHAMLAKRGDWMPLGNADEQKPAKPDTVEAWGRSADNPVGGWYGLKKGLRGRFGNYVPPVLEALGMAEVEHNPRNNRMRAL